MAEPFPLFHWSPSSRYKGICRYGLKPGCWSTDRLWRPPYVAFAGWPSLAWALSGGGPARDLDHPSWDLWMVWTSRVRGYEELRLFDGDDGALEYRVYERIYKRDVWYVATRQAAHG